MSVHARTLVVTGARRVASPAGVGLFLTFVLALAALAAAVNTLLTAVAGTSLPFGVVVAEYGVLLPVTPWVAALVVLVMPLVVAVTVVVGSRALLGRSVSRWSDPVECLTHRIVPATLATLAGVGFALAAVSVGTLLLVVPGVVVAGHLLVLPTVLAAEDVSLAAALRTSWRRAVGDRLALVTATFALVVPAALVVGGASVSYLLPPVVEFAVGVVAGAALFSLWLGLAAAAYHETDVGSARSTAASRRRRATRAL
jgi:hypothetical protein